MSCIGQPLRIAQQKDPWLEETIIDNLNEFEPEENSGHDFTSTSKHGCGCGHGWGGKKEGKMKYYHLVGK